MTDQAGLKQAVHEFATAGFAELPNAVSKSTLERLREIIEPLLPNAEEVITHHSVNNCGGLTGGARLLRFDPWHPLASKEHRARGSAQMQDSGLASLGADFAASISKLVTTIVDADLRYRRCYFLAYRSGDYISVHNDASTGERVNVQIAFSSGARSCIRILGEDNLLQVREDTPTSLRLLGPRVWHDVPPFVGDKDSLRIVFSLRYVV